MQLLEWFEKGVAPDTYMESLEKHKEAFFHIYNQFQIPANDEGFLQSLKQKKLNVIVIAEPWCGHCMLNIPVLLRLAQKSDMAVRFLARDKYPDFMDHYLTNGKRIIPIFIFINESGDEVGKWGPLAPKTKQFTDELKKDLPEKNSVNYDEKFQSLIMHTSKTFKEDESFWLASYEDIKKTLQQAM
ncbi:thioredoxin family protein [Virgibacillus sp. W0430]|uniref:thioredoxin family protein n=1 Tax=Virgibacillus sp. W0430 TaxID=3391580 RepID=UPI003F4627F8